MRCLWPFRVAGGFSRARRGVSAQWGDSIGEPTPEQTGPHNLERALQRKCTVDVGLHKLLVYPDAHVKAVVTTSDAWPDLGGVRESVARGDPGLCVGLEPADSAETAESQKNEPSSVCIHRGCQSPELQIMLSCKPLQPKILAAKGRRLPTIFCFAPAPEASPPRAT